MYVHDIYIYINVRFTLTLTYTMYSFSVRFKTRCSCEKDTSKTPPEKGGRVDGKTGSERTDRRVRKLTIVTISSRDTKEKAPTAGKTRKKKEK